MSCTISITVELDADQTHAQQRYQVAGNPKAQAAALAQLFKDLASGQASGSVSVGTGDEEPAAATGTLTLVSVIATDVANVAGVDFTFTASPTLATDVLVTVPGAKAFASSSDISLITGAITETGHGYETGMVGRLTTSGSLPTGFATSTDYFVIKIDDDSYALASSYANAVAGTRIIPTAIGSGNQTFTPTSNSFKAKQLSDAINAHPTVGQIVAATWAANVVTVTAKQKGVVGNGVRFESFDSTITADPSNGYLEDGTGGATDDAVSNSLGL